MIHYTVNVTYGSYIAPQIGFESLEQAKSSYIFNCSQAVRDAFDNRGILSGHNTTFDMDGYVSLREISNDVVFGSIEVSEKELYRFTFSSKKL